MKVGIIHDVAVSPNFGHRDAASVCVYPASTVMRNGDLFCIYRQGTAKHSRDGVLILQRSTDGGGTWSAPTTVYDGMRGHNPESVHTGVVVEAVQGEVLAFFTTVEVKKPDVYIFSEEGRALRQRLCVATSGDGGVSWSEPREVDVAGLPFNRYVGSRPLVLADGTLLLPIEATAPQGQQMMLGSLSTDGGRTFLPAFPIAHDETGRLGFGDGKFVEMEDGSVVMTTWTYRNPSEETIHVHRCVSLDGGRSWSKPEPTDLVCQILTPQCVGVPRLVAAGTVRTIPEGIRLFTSDNAGRTWDSAGAVQVWDPRELRATGEPLPLGGAGRDDTSGVWAALPSFTFGSPELLRVSANEMVMTYYAIVEGITHVRACRFRVFPRTNGED